VIPDAKLLAWEKDAERANVEHRVPAGYNAMLEEDARRLIRAKLVQYAFPAILRELRGRRHEDRMIRRDLEEFATDCSTPTFQLVRNALAVLGGIQDKVQWREQPGDAADPDVAIPEGRNPQ
jgi:hypothetical protein